MRTRPTASRRILLRAAVAIAVGCGCGQPGHAAVPDALACADAVAAADHGWQLPDGLLAAIATVESGRPDPATGLRTPWPWTVNAEGAGRYYASKSEAIAATMALRARGVASIDVGCLQVSLLHHPLAFASLEEAFDPVANARFAASFLSRLFAETLDWLKAAAAYHSRTPEIAAPYGAAVAAAWRSGAGQPPLVFGLPVLSAPATAFALAPGAPGTVSLPTAMQARVLGVSVASGRLDETWRPVLLPPPRRRHPVPPHPRGTSAR